MRILLGLVLVCVAANADASEAAPGRQQAATLDRTVRIQMDYLIYLPADYDKQERWPLLLFLHGSGERGDDLELIKKHGPPKQIHEGKNFPCIVVSPQCPKDQRWQPMALSALVDEIVENFRVDEDRIYVTGLSMGGAGSWSLAVYAPHRFAALVPICGGGEVNRAKEIAHLPTWVFHGAKDPTVPLQRSQEMVEALKKHGGDPKFTVYPDAGHDSWTQTYENAELYDWLLQQKRSSAK